MHENAKLIETFYSALNNQDGATMTACYHDDIEFSDPAFPDLRGNEAGAMWRMLCAQAQDLDVRFRDVVADDETGSAHWDADYTFSVTKRKVNNSIDAKFRFKDGKIVWHHDTFDFYAWSKMALGAPGLLLGWSGFLQKKVQAQAAENLQKFISREG